MGVEVDVVEARPARLFPSQRLLLAVMGFLGCMMVYAHRVDLSVTLICMVNQTALSGGAEESGVNGSGGGECARESGVEGAAKEPTLGAMGTFVWEKDKQGLILSSFFWGYLTTQVVGGWAGQKFGVRNIWAGTVLGATVLTLLTPLVARASWIGLTVLRIVLGMLQGATFPLVLVLWSNWAPPLERSTLTSLTFAGCQVGNVITLPFAGVLCDQGFDGGWPSVFYLLGIAGFVWALAWWWIARDSPADSTRMSVVEKSYILESLSRKEGEDFHDVRMPWCSALRSLPVWAAVIGHVTGDWGAYVMLTCLPSFMSDVLQFDLTSLGFLASIPYIAYFLVIQISGFIADYVQRMGWLSALNTRRAAMAIGLGGQGAFLLGAGYCGCGQEGLVVALLTVGMGLSGFQYSGFVVNYMDLAPLFAGQLMGFGNTMACLSGIAAPAAMAALTPNKTAAEWRGLFWLTAAILWGGALFFCVFARGVVQPWARSDQLRLHNDPKDETAAKPLVSSPTEPSTVA